MAFPGDVVQQGRVDFPSSSLMGGDCMSKDLMPCSMLLNSVGLLASDLWLLDSGASVSVVSKDFLKGFQHSPIQTLVNPLQAANGTSVNVDGFCKVLLEIQVVDGKRENKPPKPAVLPVYCISNFVGLQTWKTGLGFFLWKRGEDDT